MTFTQLLKILRARWLLASCVLLAVVGLAATVNLLRKPQYTSTASVVLDVKSPDPIAGVVLPGMTVNTYMGTQLGVMSSDRVALRALRSLKLDQDASLQQAWREATGGKGAFLAWLTDRTLNKLEVLPTRDSNIMTVAYTAPDPQLAAAMANAFVAAYIETTLELRVEPARQYSSFFDDRGKHLRDALEKAQAKLSAYQQKHDIVVTDQRFDVENVRLSELSTQLVLLQGVANDSGSRQREVDANSDRMQEVVTNPLLVSLSTELSRREGRLNELSERLGDRHPQVIEQRAAVAQARASLDSETQRVAGSVAVNNNVNQSRLLKLRAAVDEQRARVLSLKGQRDELTVLQRDVENAQRAYDMVLSRAAQSSVESQTTQTNVSVLKDAMPPARPSSPRVLLNLLVAVIAGSLLALVAATLRESFDRRVRSAADVTAGLRQPLLAVLPRNAPPRAGSRLRFLPARVAAPAQAQATRTPA